MTDFLHGNADVAMAEPIQPTDVLPVITECFKMLPTLDNLGIVT
jgi:hypothetical protein